MISDNILSSVVCKLLCYIPNKRIKSVHVVGHRPGGAVETLDPKSQLQVYF